MRWQSQITKDHYKAIHQSTTAIHVSLFSLNTLYIKFFMLKTRNITNKNKPEIVKTDI